jgi:hypothetical protein
MRLSRFKVREGTLRRQKSGEHHGNGQCEDRFHQFRSVEFFCRLLSGRRWVRTASSKARQGEKETLRFEVIGVRGERSLAAGTVKKSEITIRRAIVAAPRESAHSFPVFNKEPGWHQ